MEHQNKISTLNIFKMLWERKVFYLIGLLLGIGAAFLCWILGSKVGISDFIIVPLAASFEFGFLIYLVVKEPKRLKKEGRTIIFSKEGLIHLALCFGTIIVCGVIYNILKVVLHLSVE